MTPRVLVVSARTAFAEPLSVALRASELDYVGARTVPAALQIASGEELPTAVVVDLMRVTGDASGLCDAIRARDQGGGVPIIFCGTGAESIRSTSDALIAGGDGYFALPCDVQRVVAKLATYIGCPVPDLPSTMVLPAAEADGDVSTDPAGSGGGEDPDAASQALSTAEGEALPPSVARSSWDEPTPVPQGSEPPAAVDPSALLDVTVSMARPTPVSGLPRQRAAHGAGDGATLSGATLSGATLSDAPVDDDAEEAIREAAAGATRAAAREVEAQRQRARLEADAEEVRAATERAAVLRREDERREHERRQAEERAQRDLAEAQQRSDEERARLSALSEQRRDEEREHQRSLEAAREREARERERLQQLAAERERAEEESASAREQARRREADEQERLQQLSRTREEAEAAARRAMEQAAERELEAKRALDELEALRQREQGKLSELVQTRERAEQQARASLQEAEELAQQARRALEETQGQEARERERLAALELERVRAESEAVRVRAEAAEQEMALRSAIEDLERHRRALELEAQRKEEDNKRRLVEDGDRLRLLEGERKRLEEEARREDEERRRKAEAEEQELRAIAERRARAEQELREAIDERMALVAEEDRRLQAVRAERDAALRDAQDADARRARDATEAQRQLDEARAARAQAEAEAQQELAKLRRIREEDQLAQRELDEKRARARLAFTTGRLDAMPAGESAGGVDVGSARRPATDAEGQVLGGGDPALGALETELPPPPPFLPLEPTRGRFADGELPALLWAAHHLKVTGALQLTTDDGRARTLFLEEGEPVMVASVLQADRPEEGLLRAGLITTAQYNELRNGPLRSPRRTAAALLADGVLKTEEVFPAVRGVLVEQVLSLMEWEGGAFAYLEERAHASDRVRLEHSFAAVLAESVRRKMDERRLWGVLGGPATLVAPDDVTRALPPLAPDEKLVLARFDGTRSLEDIIVETGVSAVVVLRTALIALSCGAVRVLARGLPADPNARAAQRERSVAIDRTRVMDRLQAARHGDYFTFLGVTPNASAFEVHRAAERIRQRFDPARFSDPAFGDLRTALKEISDVSVDAEAVLADEALAESYRRALSSSSPPRAGHRRAGSAS